MPPQPNPKDSRRRRLADVEISHARLGRGGRGYDVAVGSVTSMLHLHIRNMQPVVSEHTPGLSGVRMMGKQLKLSRRERLAGASMLIVLWPTIALAEVMDKEPSLLELWSWTGLLILVAHFLARGKPWIPIILLPFSGFYALGIVGELLDRTFHFKLG